MQEGDAPSLPPARRARARRHRFPRPCLPARAAVGAGRRHQPGRSPGRRADRELRLRPGDPLRAQAASRDDQAAALAGGQRPRRVLGLLPLREVGQALRLAARGEPGDRLASRRLQRGRPPHRDQAHPPAARAGRGRQPAGPRPPHGRGGADLELRLLGRRDVRFRAVLRLLHEARQAPQALRSHRRPPGPRPHRDVQGGRRRAGELLALMDQRRGHTGRVRRASLIACVLAAGLLAGCGSNASDERPAAPSAAAAATTPDALPPLPTKTHAKVVQPVAGGSVRSAAPSAPITDPGLEDVGPAPTGAATSGTRRTSADTATRVAVDRASALPNGVAVPPLEAPEEVKQIIEAGNIIARSPYVWGGGHGKWLDKGYDCSGSVSFALAAAGLLNGPLDSGHLAQWGRPGPGRWVTIYANAGHVFMGVAGIRFDTSGQRVTGSRWQNDGRPTAGFSVRHPE